MQLDWPADILIEDGVRASRPQPLEADETSAPKNDYEALSHLVKRRVTTTRCLEHPVSQA